jgi:hypothetical protein
VWWKKGEGRFLAFFKGGTKNSIFHVEDDEMPYPVATAVITLNLIEPKRA